MRSEELTQELLETPKAFHANWVDVAHESDSAGWDWSAVSVFYSPSERRYFWYSDSGCSCNWHMDSSLSKDDFENGSKEDAMRALEGWDEAKEEVRKFKP